MQDVNLRGEGVGRKLVGEAIRFSRERGYAMIFLWTERRLEAAAGLYRAVGFQLTANGRNGAEI
jgi:ribosomal protein S18 acetylase RimI-like enzyme